jgi:predicted Fe-Mo cluster-binding NifX family protein
VDVLICGGIGGGAQMALANAGIRLYGGVSGDADEAVELFLSGALAYNPAPRCNHHDSHHDHHCGDNHHCGGHCH